jgi:tRNA (guanine-N7-)-methyltransferase
MAKNKLEKFDDMDSYDHVFQYSFEQLQQGGFPLQGRWGAEFFHNDHPIVIELGCGRGEYTVGLAERYPEKNFIGVDIKGARMWTGATTALQQGMKNVAFLRTKIELLPYFFAAGEVSEIWITFPDPQMRKVNKRLTSTRFMQHYAKVLRPEGLIHLKCDSPFLFTYTDAMIAVNHLPVIWKSTDLYNTQETVPEGAPVDLEALRSIRTYYESQWLARGISIKYLGWRLTPPEAWQEPEIEIELDSYRSFGRDKRSQLETHV